MAELGARWLGTRVSTGMDLGLYRAVGRSLV